MVPLSGAGAGRGMAMIGAAAMIRMPVLAGALAGAALLGGCARSTNLDPRGVDLPTEGRVLLVPGSMSVVSARIRGPAVPVLCIAPSPDWAVASGSTIRLTASGGAKGTADATLSGERGQTEAISTLGGRTAGVVALRDGLYAACQAYSNGLIGRVDYALILSQYGEILTEIAQGDAAPTAPAPPPAAARRPARSDPGDDRAFRALLVACLTAYDPSLPVEPNRLLDAFTCRRVVARAAGGTGLR